MDAFLIIVSIILAILIILAAVYIMIIYSHPDGFLYIYNKNLIIF
jgi:hypothetical protein